MKNFIVLVAIACLLASCGNKKEYVNTEYFTHGSIVTIYPEALNGECFVFDQDDMGLGCSVQDETGKELLYGGRIIFLTSLADKKYYFIALNDDKTAIAYDDKGNKLFAIDRKKMLEFPAPIWSGISMEHVIIKDKLNALKM